MIFFMKETVNTFIVLSVLVHYSFAAAFSHSQAPEQSGAVPCNNL